MEARPLQGSDWLDLIEVLHGLTNMITVRAHYSEGHPAIAHADRLAGEGFTRILERIPEIVVALLDAEFVICERPMPDLRDRLKVLAEAMRRHDMECIVFERGMTPAECGVLGRALASPADQQGKVRERAQGQMAHVLLRFAEIRKQDKERAGGAASAYLVPKVQAMLDGVAVAINEDRAIDQDVVRAIAQEVVGAAQGRVFLLEERCHSAGSFDLASHATNVALMTAAMAVDSAYPERVCVDAAAAALLHDVGHLLLPPEVRGVPEPMLDERARPIFRNHTFAGALVLFGAGCPPLWVSAAFEHHRGVDGGGYPALDSKEAPHELVRMIALASYLDRKRARIGGVGQDAMEALRGAAALEDRYFGRTVVRRFLHSLGVFPPGTTVELTDRQPALVLRTNSADPWRPQVKLLRGPDSGKRVELRDMNGVEGRHERSVVRAIAPPLFLPGDVVEPATAEEEAARAAAKSDASKSLPPGLAEALASSGAGVGGALDVLLNAPADALSTVRNVLVSSPPGPLGSSMRPMAPAPPAGGAVSVKPPVAITGRPASAASQAPPASQAKPARSQAPPASQPKPAASQVPPASVSLPPRVASLPPKVSVTRPPAAATAALEGTPSLAVSPGDLAKLALDHRAGFVLSMVDGMSDLETIVDASGIPREEVERVLAELVLRGVVKMKK